MPDELFSELDNFDERFRYVFKWRMGKLCIIYDSLLKEDIGCVQTTDIDDPKAFIAANGVIYIREKDLK